jgi:hypothetical protein
MATFASFIAKGATMAKLRFFADDRRNYRLINNQDKSNNQTTHPSLGA